MADQGPQIAPLNQKTSDHLGEILKRIDERCEKLRLSDRAASISAGLSPGQIRTMRRQHDKNIQHGVSSRTITQLAKALGTAPEWLMSGTGLEEAAAIETTPAAPAGRLRMAGVVAAGVWMEAASDDHELRYVQVPPDPRYPAQCQSAYEVRGTSTDRFARPGDFLIAVDSVAAGISPRAGDIVIVMRKKDGLREVTARRCQGKAPDYELRFESTDPNHRSSLLVRTLDDLKQGGLILADIVVAVYRPFM